MNGPAGSSASEPEEEPEGALAASVESPQRRLRFFAVGRSTSGRSAVEMLAEGFDRV